MATKVQLMPELAVQTKESSRGQKINGRIFLFCRMALQISILRTGAYPCTAPLYKGLRSYLIIEQRVSRMSKKGEKGIALCISTSAPRKACKGSSMISFARSFTMASKIRSSASESGLSPPSMATMRLQSAPVKYNRLLLVFFFSPYNTNGYRENE